jgi:hypothetical protein
MQGPCVGCGSVTNTEIHHVKKLSNTAKSKFSIHQIMSKLGRKEIVVCKKCHLYIHSGAYDINKHHEKAK